MRSEVGFPTAPEYSQEAHRRSSEASPLPVASDHGNCRGDGATRSGEGATLPASPSLARLWGLISCLGMLVATTCLSPIAIQAQHGGGNPLPESGGNGSISNSRDEGRLTRANGPEPLDPKQVKALVQSNFEKTKKDAAELAALARQLQEELDEQDATTLSLESMNRIDRIEKLAKKIRDEMKGF